MDQYGPGDPRGLVGDSHGGDLDRPPRQELLTPGSGGSVWLSSRCVEQRLSALHEQAAQIGVALLGRAPELAFTAARSRLRSKPQPGRQIAPGGNRLGSPMLAISALAVSGPIPGTLTSLLLVSFVLCRKSISRSNKAVLRLSC